MSVAAGYSGNLEINAAVDAGQSFHLNRAVLQVDQPVGFLGQFDAVPSQGGGEVKLEGLSAASWDVNGSSVEVFDAASSVIDTVGPTASQDPSTLTVYTGTDPTYGSVVLIASRASFSAPSFSAPSTASSSARPA